MGPIMNSLFPQAYTDLFAETHANVCSSTGATVQSFSGGLSGHGFLKNVLEHYIKNQAWGPNGPQSYEDLCHESQQWNMSAGQDHKGKINLRWINDTAPLRPIPAKPTVASTLILETAFPTLALTSVKEGKKLVDKQLGWIDVSLCKDHQGLRRAVWPTHLLLQHGFDPPQGVLAAQVCRCRPG
jgi:hypothetical protein